MVSQDEALLKHASRVNDYDPYKHRKPEMSMTNTEAFVSVVKCAIGTGCLAMPMAFYHAGWLNGLISTVVIGIILIYGLHLLIENMYEACKRKRVPVLSYPEAMRIAMEEGPAILRCCGSTAAVFVDIFLGLYHFGVCCVYVVFIADNLKQVGDIYVELDARYYMIMLIGPLTLIYMIRDLKHLVPFSGLANVLLFCGFAIVFYYVFENLPPLSERRAFQKLENYPLFFGTVLFSIESVGVVVSIEANMEHPENYLGATGVLCAGLSFSLVIYAAFGFFGYWRFGDDVQGSVTLNLPNDELLPQLVKIIFAVSIYFTYALQGYVTMSVTWSYYSQLVEKESRRALEYVMRMCIVLATVLCALVNPNFAEILSLVGSFCLSHLGLIFPGLFDLGIKYKVGYGPLYVYLIQDVFLILFGMIGGSIGTLFSMKALYTDYYTSK